MELHYPLILDGATGSQLYARGCPADYCQEKFSYENPDVVRAFQQEYLDAGSNVLYTPTFGANRVKLEENGILNRVYDYNYRLAKISKDLAGDKAYVAGDISPLGKFLAPMGNMTFEEMVDVYKEQAQPLEDAGVDFFIIETMMTVPESRAAVLAVKSVSDKPVFVTFSVDGNGNTLNGSDIEAIITIMQGMGVNAFGLNCSVGPFDMLEAEKRLTPYAQIPLIAKANAGLPKLVDGITVYDTPPSEFARCVPEFAKAGVMIFGGCCGTKAEHIKAISEAAAECKMVRPADKYADKILAATEKKVFVLEPDVTVDKVFACDDDLIDALEEAENDGSKVIGIEIKNEDELDIFAEYQYAVTKPLCIVCDDADLLEQALRLYQGRALYEGNLPDSVLLPLSKKYGLVF